jgi:hypothetical protein
MYRYSLLILVLMTLAKPASAQLWDYIVTSVDGSAYYIDPLSINEYTEGFTYRWKIHTLRGAVQAQRLRAQSDEYISASRIWKGIG